VFCYGYRKLSVKMHYVSQPRRPRLELSVLFCASPWCDTDRQSQDAVNTDVIWSGQSSFPQHTLRKKNFRLESTVKYRHNSTSTSLSIQKLLGVPETDHDGFMPYPFQFTILSHPACRCSTTYRVQKASWYIYTKNELITSQICPLHDNWFMYGLLFR